MAKSDYSQTPLRFLVGISGLETVALAVAAGFLVVGLISGGADSYASALFLTLIVIGFAVGLAAVTIGLWRGSTAARSASLVWQVLQMGVGLASDSGVFGIPMVALGLAVPAVTVIVLILFNPTVRQHFSDGDAD